MLPILTLTAMIVAALFAVSRWVERPRTPFVQPSRPADLPACVIRELTARDLAACEEIYRLNEPDRFPEGVREHFGGFIRDRQKALFLVAEAEGEVCGFGGIAMRREGKLEIAHLVFGMVHPSRQRRGFGTALLLARMAVLPVPRRWWTVLLMPVGGSESFYARFGFAFGMTTMTTLGAPGDLYRVALTAKSQAQCIERLGDRLRVELLGKLYIPGWNHG